jgi:hypothetical protein
MSYAEPVAAKDAAKVIEEFQRRRWRHILSLPPLAVSLPARFFSPQIAEGWDLPAWLVAALALFARLASVSYGLIFYRCPAGNASPLGSASGAGPPGVMLNPERCPSCKVQLRSD